ncbi:MAG TPA: 16S rRNA (guanine(966)-N(2))-methyltransferase RsmD [Actinomycetaceae bacterium]|nr:16S rRNA (guanine(966)-N(2))-methyltransferase RsmD [Actinomycetaceae bacterium]
MTRIVAGIAGGRSLDVPRSATRPTSERVREALFSRLDHEGALDEAHVLDLYAGSGALGLEAASRGAAGVVLVDRARSAAATCLKNARRLALPADIDVEATTALTYLGSNHPTAMDVVFIDPPYDLSEEELTEVLRLLTLGWLAPQARIVIERSRRSPAPIWPAGIVPEGSRRYGDTVVWFAGPTSLGTTVAGMAEGNEGS